MGAGGLNDQSRALRTNRFHLYSDFGPKRTVGECMVGPIRSGLPLHWEQRRCAP